MRCRKIVVDEEEFSLPTREDRKAGKKAEAEVPSLAPRASAESLSVYMKAISRIPLLTKKQERDLAARAKKGDRHARDMMIKANLRLVVAVARRYRGMGLPLSDLISEGNLGLIKAVERFKHRRDSASARMPPNGFVRQSPRRWQLTAGPSGYPPM